MHYFVIQAQHASAAASLNSILHRLVKDAFGILLFVGDPAPEVGREAVILPGGGIGSRTAHTGAPHGCHTLHRHCCIQSRAGDGMPRPMPGSARAAPDAGQSGAVSRLLLHSCNGTLHSRQGTQREVLEMKTEERNP